MTDQLPDPARGAGLEIEEQPHGPTCAQRIAPAAECTCGKADAYAARDELERHRAEARAIAEQIIEGDETLETPDFQRLAELVIERDGDDTAGTPDHNRRA